MIWLFDNHRKYPNILKPNIYYGLKTHDVMDKACTTRNCMQQKSRERTRKACLNVLLWIKPGVDKSIPVKLDLLDFKLLSRFISTFKKIMKRKDHKGQEFNATDGTISREQELEVRLGAST